MLDLLNPRIMIHLLSLKCIAVQNTFTHNRQLIIQALWYFIYRQVVKESHSLNFKVLFTGKFWKRFGTWLYWRDIKSEIAIKFLQVRKIFIFDFDISAYLRPLPILARGRIFWYLFYVRNVYYGSIGAGFTRKLLFQFLLQFLV